VPRSKYTKAPGPLQTIALDAFRFDDDVKRKLVALLPLPLQQLSVPESFNRKARLSGPAQFETMAEPIIAWTQEQIQFYLALSAATGGAPTNRANVRAAISKLRAALKPFVEGWVDNKTATIIPNTLDRRLAKRERELAKMRRLPPVKRRNLGFLCQNIGCFLKHYELENQVAFVERDAIRYVATALDYAGIQHSYSTENPSRFAALVFPKS
jgi:hypothetical protein